MSDAGQTVSIVTFPCGGFCFGVESRLVRALHALSPVPLPEGTVAVECYLGLGEPDATARRYLIEFGHAESATLLCVAAPVEMVSIAHDQLHPIPQAVHARSTLRHAIALALSNESVTVIVSPP